PKMRTSAELRAGFRAFFEAKGHTFRPSASLIPRADDRTVLLTTAGMQPLMPYFLGREPPPAPLLTTVQKCFRTPDIDEVGLDGSHLTFFEMHGNFSFGQYFNEGAIGTVAASRTASLASLAAGVSWSSGRSCSWSSSGMPTAS